MNDISPSLKIATTLKIEGMTCVACATRLEKVFSTQEILEGLDYINQTLTLHGLVPMTLEQYKETLKYPISDEILPHR